MKTVYFLVGNGWLLLAAWAVLSKNAAWHESGLSTLIGIGAWLCCVLIGVVCLCVAWTVKGTD